MTVKHSRGSYDIDFTNFAHAMGRLPDDSVILTDENVAKHWSPYFPDGIPVLVFEPGEGMKCLAKFGEANRWLASQGATRSTTLVAVGGGVVGDLGGFVAASYMRGIPYVQVPTTLLSQVDSSVGGKVGIDLPEGKNLVGAFHAPVAVHVAMDSLQTLPKRHFVNGMAEVCKYGFIYDENLADQLSQEQLESDSENLGAIVRRCLEIKAEVVEADEYETTGLRAILNFGHTIGHAIEQVTGYGPILHGEAISIGMDAEARLGEALGITPPRVAQDVRNVLEKQGLPIYDEVMERADELIAAMRKDKKADRGELAFSFLTKLGGCKLVKDVPEQEVRKVLVEK